MTPAERANRRLLFTMDLARQFPELRPPEHTPEEYVKAFVMAPLRFYRDLKLEPEAESAPHFASGVAFQHRPPGGHPETPAGRLETLMELTRPRPVVDDDGEPTGEMSEPIMSADEAVRFLGGAE